jgi:hypothetical protein
VTTLPRLGGVLGAPVLAHDLRLGTVTGVVCDARWERLLGLEATSMDGSRRFLPWVAVELREGVVGIGSSLLLVDTGELDGYVRLGAVVVRDPMQLSDLGVGAGGEIMHGKGDPGVSRETGSGTGTA